MAKKQIEDVGPQPPAWLAREGEWLTWWDQHGPDESNKTGVASHGWAIHLVRNAQGEHRVWLCQDGDKKRSFEFDESELERVIASLRAAAALANEGSQAPGGDDA